MTKLEKMQQTYHILADAARQLEELDSTDVVIKNNIVRIKQSLPSINRKIQVLTDLKYKPLIKTK